MGNTTYWYDNDVSSYSETSSMKSLTYTTCQVCEKHVDHKTDDIGEGVSESEMEMTDTFGDTATPTAAMGTKGLVFLRKLL